MKIRFGIVGRGFLGNIVANAWKDGFLEDYELVGVTSRSQESRDKTAAETGCRSCRDLAELLSLEPEYIVEAASVEAVRDMACTVLEHGVSLVLPLDRCFCRQPPLRAGQGRDPQRMRQSPSGKRRDRWF